MASPNELARALGVPLGRVRYHVRRLEQLGFLRLVKRVPRRGATEHFYRICAEGDADDPMPDIERALAAEGSSRAALRVLLDATGMVDLRVAVQQLGLQLRRLETEAVGRAGIHGTGSLFAVNVRFALEPVSDHADYLTAP